MGESTIALNLALTYVEETADLVKPPARAIQ